MPDEVAPDWATELELVSDPQLIGQIGRDLSVLEPFDRDHETFVGGRGRDRVAALCLVAIGGRETNVEVLAGPVTGPLGSVQNDAFGPSGFVDELDWRRQLELLSEQHNKKPLAE